MGSSGFSLKNIVFSGIIISESLYNFVGAILHKPEASWDKMFNFLKSSTKIPVGRARFKLSIISKHFKEHQATVLLFRKSVGILNLENSALIFLCYK